MAVPAEAGAVPLEVNLGGEEGGTAAPIAGSSLDSSDGGWQGEDTPRSGGGDGASSSGGSGGATSSGRESAGDEAGVPGADSQPEAGSSGRGDGGGLTDGLPAALPRVPWGLNTTVTLMVVWLLGFWAAAYVAVPGLLGALGVEAAAGASGRVLALKHLLLDAFQLGITAFLLRRGLAQYRPAALGLFAVRWRPAAAWLPTVAAGLASFPVVDWVHRRMVALLTGEDFLLSGPMEQIVATRDWGAQALWFLVLAVCAPVWEEAMFRGFLLPSLARWMPSWAAAASSALVFGLVHFTREGFLPLVMLGGVFGAAYVRTRNLLPSMLLHSLWNVCLLAQLLATGG